MNVIRPEGCVPIKMWTDEITGPDGEKGHIEDAAQVQLANVASLPFIHSHIAVMPDVHWGCGATVGSVIATKGAIVPAAVGVDIGCGMMAVLTTLTANDLPDSLAGLRFCIESAIPHGRSDNGGLNDVGGWNSNGGPPLDVESAWSQLYREHMGLVEQHPKLSKANTINHLGTLGTGNHFIEICLDEQDRVWAMLHSGSRGIGNRIGTYFISKAKTACSQYFVKLPHNDLAYFPQGTPGFNDYVAAVSWAQRFALANRECMMAAVIDVLTGYFKDKGPILDIDAAFAVSCHHNYVSQEKHFGKRVLVTRKGAVKASLGMLGIIPGSMGAKSFIVRGKGNRDSFHSCSHGAGRAMSRTAAKKLFTLEDHERDTAGVECRKDEGVLDETPKAYKDIDEVMASQADLVDIVHTLKQVVCVKG